MAYFPCMCGALDCPSCGVAFGAAYHVGGPDCLNCGDDANFCNCEYYPEGEHAVVVPDVEFEFDRPESPRPEYEDSDPNIPF
jgi:hypothetical protein